MKRSPRQRHRTATTSRLLSAAPRRKRSSSATRQPRRRRSKLSPRSPRSSSPRTSFASSEDPVNVGLAAVALVPGLAVGSFLNVVAARVPLGRSIVHPGSACMACSTQLAWYDNIPLFSYVKLRGRCRHCGVAISLRYPAVEALTALLIAGCVLKFGFHWEALIASIFCAALVAVSAT